MKIYVVSFTRGGSDLNRRLISTLDIDDIQGYTYKKFLEHDEKKLIALDESIADWLEKRFYNTDAFIFIGAIGITVRLISGLLKDKFSDPAIICIDEAGDFVVPILSGHVGGANELSRRIAGELKAQAVITTATDVRNLWAVDEWAVNHNLFITDRKLAKDISAAILDNKKVGLFSDYEVDLSGISYIEKDKEHEVNIYIGHRIRLDDICRKPCLRLVPDNIALGVGCKKDMDIEHMHVSCELFLEKHNIDKKAVKYIGSIDLKKEEKAIISLAKSLDVDFITFTKEELSSLEGEFSSSGFVASNVGVDNVCERAASMFYKHILIRKEAYQGITFAATCDTELKYKL